MPAEVLALRKKVSSTKAMLNAAVERRGYGSKDPSFFEDHFQEVLQGLMDEGLKLLHGEQKPIIREIIGLWNKYDESDPERADLILWKGIQSMTQQKKKRAGVHMERSVDWVLTKCEIPHENGKPVTGRSDLVCPNLATFEEHSERCIVLEFKRTIRERWKEVRDEISRAGKNVWLVTLDDYIANDAVDLIAEGNIILYVPQQVKERLRSRPGNLRSLRTLLPDLRAVAGPSRQQVLGREP